MRLRRGGRAVPGDGKPIADFWGWWASAGRAAAEAGIGGAGFRRFTSEMTARVQAMHSDLAWELAPGARAKHALIVTAAGVPGQRRIAERWYQQAPPVGSVWEFHPARQASPASLAAVLEIDGRKLKVAELRFDLYVDNDRDVIDTVVFHPAFAQMPPEARVQVGFLALDWALGEDGVTRWIGAFDTTDKRPAASVPADGLIETVQALASRASRPRWVLLRGERDGAVFLASLAIPAKWVDHPLLDQHIAVRLPFAGQAPAGLPDPDSLDQLRGLEDELTSRLPAYVLLVAHETTRGVRTLHLFADSDDPAVPRQVQDIVSRWPGATVSARPDAGWRAIRHLTR
jgi:Family of unknown function (DUF695)